MRYFPIGARGDTHVALRVVEDLARRDPGRDPAGRARGASGHVVVDIGLVDI